MSTSSVPPSVQPPDYPGEQYQSPQPNFQPKKILSTPARIILAIVGAVAVLLVIGLVAACASDSSPYAQGLAFDPGDESAVIGGPQALVGWLTANDPYDMSTQAGTQWALGTEVAYEQRVLIGDPANDGTTITSVVVDPATVTLSSDGLSFQAVLTFSDGTSQTSAVADPLTGWNQGVYGASWSSAPAPAVTQAPVTQAPVTQAPADTPAAAVPVDTPTPAPPPPTRPVFGCYVNDNEPGADAEYGASINIVSGGNGYSSAVVKVVLLDKNGRALGTQTVTAYSSTENWQVIIYPEGGPQSLATEASCTATVESAS